MDVKPSRQPQELPEHLVLALRQAPHLPRTGDGYNKRQMTALEEEQLFRAVAADDDLDLADLAPKRHATALRLVRAMLHARGYLDRGEALNQLRPPAGGADPWHDPRRVTDDPRVRNGSGSPASDRWWRLRAVLARAEEHGGLPILPPLVPDTKNYDERRDPLLALYVEALAAVAEALRVSRGTPRDRDRGRHGLLGLLDVQLVRIAVPSAHALQVQERFVLQECIDAYLRSDGRISAGGFNAVRQHLRDEHGYEDDEIEGTYALAQDRASQQLGDVQKSKALWLLQLEDFMRRARDRGDQVRELAAQKLYALVAGYARAEDQDLDTIFTRTVARVSHEQDAARPIKMLGNGRNGA
jgi:hypothetical protein